MATVAVPPTTEVVQLGAVSLVEDETRADTPHREATTSEAASARHAVDTLSLSTRSTASALPPPTDAEEHEGLPPEEQEQGREHEQEPFVLEGTPVPDGEYTQWQQDPNIITGSPVVGRRRQLDLDVEETESEDELIHGRVGRRERVRAINREYDRDGRRVRVDRLPEGAPRPGRCYNCCCTQHTKYGRFCSLLGIFGFVMLTGFMR